jgi:hypothetical protein
MLVTASSGPSVFEDGFVITAMPDVSSSNEVASIPFQNLTLYVPSLDSPYRDVGFTTESYLAGARMNGFYLLGVQLYVTRQGSGNGFGMAFSAAPTGTPGIWSIGWNVTGPWRKDEGRVGVVLKTV